MHSFTLVIRRLIHSALAVVLLAPMAGKAQDSSSDPLGQLLRGYLDIRGNQLGTLADGYSRALKAQFQRAADDGNLKLATAIKSEQDSLTALETALADRAAPLSAKVGQPSGLPTLSDEAPTALIQLRATWDTERSRIDDPLKVRLIQSLKDLESELTRARNLELAQSALALRKTLEEARGGGVSEEETLSGGAMESTASSPVRASREEPFENSLEMRFIPVPITGGPTDGKTVLFSIWETRVADYEAYARRNRDINTRWKDFKAAGFEQTGETDPVIAVNWQDARGFCKWLTETERRRNVIGANDVYRLPSDHEWSCAIGIGEKEDPLQAPHLKSSRIQEFLWGNAFPPPEGTANLAGTDATFRVPISGYQDGFPFTAPVGSFPMDQRNGLFDLAGNAAEWCEDRFDPSSDELRVIRGGSWARNTLNRFRVSYRFDDLPASDRSPDLGFRSVLELNATP